MQAKVRVTVECPRCHRGMWAVKEGVMCANPACDEFKKVYRIIEAQHVELEYVKQGDFEIS